MIQKAENARERFEKAAMTLFRERGYAGTTVPDIARRAGLTERTFFRYFADKPEVLFWRAGELEANIIAAVETAPMARKSLEALCTAVETVGTFFDANRQDVAARQLLVAAHPEFQAREALKKQSLALAIASALRSRGMQEPSARLLAEAGMTVWRIALERWSIDEGQLSFARHVSSTRQQFEKAVTGSERAKA